MTVDRSLDHLPPAAGRLARAVGAPENGGGGVRHRAGRAGLDLSRFAGRGVGGPGWGGIFSARVCRHLPSGAGNRRRSFSGRLDVGRDGAGDDAAERRAHDLHLRRDRRHRRAQGRAHRVAFGAGGRLCRRLARLCGRRRARATRFHARRAGSTAPWRRRARCLPARSSSPPGSTSSPRSRTPVSRNASGRSRSSSRIGRPRARGVFRLGLQQGLYCLGCCWAMMLLMFAVGVMNVLWMAGARHGDDDREDAARAPLQLRYRRCDAGGRPWLHGRGRRRPLAAAGKLS